MYILSHDQVGKAVDVSFQNFANSALKSILDNGANTIGGFVNKISGVEASNQAAAQAAADQRQWEADMDNTKYQRAVQDMKAAGLNPAMLSGLSSSSVGSAPSGAAASTHGPAGNIIGSLISLVALLALKDKGLVRNGNALAKSGDYANYVNNVKGHLTW